MDWKPYAQRLAAEVTPSVSRWRAAVATTPRHVFVPRWWEPAGGGVWALRDGPADKEADGGARGVVEWDRAGFMSTRTGVDYPPGEGELFGAVRDHEGEQVTEGRYPVLNVAEAWDVRAMLELAVPGVETHYEERGEQRTAWLVHTDGSWARASATWIDPPTVHQSGPRRLWTALERIRHRLNTEGGLPIYGSRVHITPDGVCHFTRGQWSARYG
ncbi:hypothetical protein [Streptomyces sp. NPDC006012]|uniref:hypothetical protein n=1 Tax=Streptomyces sp. NPDC006012 TaxID=3364739 RepID=UPI0036C8172F